MHGWTTPFATSFSCCASCGFTHLELAVGRRAVAEEETPRADGEPPTDNLLEELERWPSSARNGSLAKTRTQVVYGVGNPKPT